MRVTENLIQASFLIYTLRLFILTPSPRNLVLSFTTLSSSPPIRTSHLWQKKGWVTWMPVTDQAIIEARKVDQI